MDCGVGSGTTTVPGETGLEGMSGEGRGSTGVAFPRSSAARICATNDAAGLLLLGPGAGRLAFFAIGAVRSSSVVSEMGATDATLPDCEPIDDGGALGDDE